MRFATICCALLVSGAMLAQEPSQPIVRSIRIKLVSTGNTPLKPVEMDTITKAFESKGIDLALEHRFDPSTVDKAADVIRFVFGDTGQNVRVEHTLKQIPPRSLEVAFQVIQLN